jgi:hypothetical protein
MRRVLRRSAKQARAARVFQMKEFHLKAVLVEGAMSARMGGWFMR